ncbi:hypothetical protein TEK04_15020 [Klenkia sp. LSe6-5]|uniref:Uncharacterized protein n=1 Tax=Klenkia sesuvii TaxID=3103137 RepID=A0ABU8DWI5_9ACTN
MTRWGVVFPDEWAVIRTGPRGQRQIGQLVAAMQGADPDAVRALEGQLRGMAGQLDAAGVDVLASLVLPVGDGTAVSAVCAVAVVALDDPSPDALRRLAESGPHPGGARRTSRTELPLGPASRSASERLAVELTGASGTAPIQAEVRYVVRIDDGVVLILHFETLSVAYLTELSDVFDAVAGTARLA